MTPKQKQKRRAREAARRKAQVQAQHNRELIAAEGRGKLTGFEQGLKIGARETREQVLRHAGELYKANRDSDAAAVREVHASITQAQGASAAVANGEELKKV